MELRPELLPPVLDEAEVTHLARLAARLDGPRNEQDRRDVDAFNRMAGTALDAHEFRGISSGCSHKEWARRVLWFRRVRPAAGASREELAEVVRRATPGNGFDDYEGYMAVLDANTWAGAWNLIFYPPDYERTTNTWGGGRPIAEWSPSPEEIVDWVLKTKERASRRQGQ